MLKILALTVQARSLELNVEIDAFLSQADYRIFFQGLYSFED